MLLKRNDNRKVNNSRETHNFDWLSAKFSDFTYSNEGYVYFKNKEIEHYSQSLLFEGEYRYELIQKLTELLRRCHYCEVHDLAVNCTNVIWRWDEISGENKEPELLRKIASEILSIHSGEYGCCDKGYICNVIASRTGLGDGSSNFSNFYKGTTIILPDQIKKASEFICSVYPGLSGKCREVYKIIETQLPLQKVTA